MPILHFLECAIDIIPRSQRRFACFAVAVRGEIFPFDNGAMVYRVSSRLRAGTCRAKGSIGANPARGDEVAVVELNCSTKASRCRESSFLNPNDGLFRTLSRAGSRSAATSYFTFEIAHPRLKSPKLQKIRFHIRFQKHVAMFEGPFVFAGPFDRFHLLQSGQSFCGQHPPSRPKWPDRCPSTPVPPG
jgi:hypothetical protein